MSALRNIAKTALAILREIADENAYERHLRAQNTKHSKDEWRRFCELRFNAKYRRAKCC